MAKKILIIEDEREIREAISEELHDAGYAISEATDGADGLEKIQADAPDLILCDIAMPRIDGLETLIQLRANFPKLANTPFVFLTAFSDRQRQIKAQKAGADDFLQKPVDFELLQEVVKNQLRKLDTAQTNENQKLVKLYKELQPNDVQSDIGVSKDVAQVARDVWENSVGNRTNTAPASELAYRAGGRLALVGLQSIKEELGDTWDAFATQIGAIAENVISRHLEPGDRFQQKDTETFELCFQDPEEGKVESIVEHIKLGVRQAISSAHSSGDFEEYNLSSNHISQVSRLDSQLFEINVPSEAARNDTELMQIVSGAISEAATDLARDASQMVLRLVRHGVVEPMQVFTPARKKANRIVLDFDQDHRAIVRKLCNALSEDKKTMLDLDLARVGLACRYTMDHVYDDRNLMLVPINTSSILDRYASQKFFRACSGMPDAVRSSLVFVFENDVDATHPSILSDAIRSTKPICKEGVLRIRCLSPLSPQHNANVISSVMLSYFDYETSLEQDGSQLRKFKQSVQKNNVDLVVDTLVKKRHVDNITSLKPDYLCFAKR